MAGAGMIGGLISSGVQGDFASQAARQQQEAAAAALEEQNRILAGQERQNAALTGQGVSALQQGTQQGVGAIQQGLGQAQGYLGQGLQYGQNAIQGGLGQAGNSLAPVTNLAGQFTPGATNTLQAQNVMGTRSRLGEMYDGNFNLQMDPGYQFRQQQGEQALGRMSSAAGGRLGGAALKGLAEFNSGLASQEYGAAFNRQMGLASGADQFGGMLALNQAGRQDQMGMQAQQNQYGLASMGYGGMGQLAGMQYGAGNNLANLGANAYGQMSNNAMGAYGQMGSMYGQMGQGMAGLYGNQMTANQQLAMQNQANQLNPVGLAGADRAAWSNAAGQFAGANYSLAAGAMGGVGGAAGAASGG